MKVVLVIALLLLGAGCSDDSSRSDTPPLAFPGAGVDCPTDEPRPVTADLAIEALSEEGFGVEFDRSACGLGEIAGMLSNASSARDVLEDEGVVVCFLFVRPRDGITPEVSGAAGGTHAELSFANLSCDLYAGRLPADDEVARFERSFDRLRAHVG